MSNATSCSNPIRKEKYNWQDNPYEQTAQTRSGAPWLWLLLWLVAPGSKLSRRCWLVGSSDNRVPLFFLDGLK